MPEDNQKVPSQIFRWFEKMKSNYEQNVQSVLQRFEEYSHSQQLRIDQANQSTIDNLKLSHQKHLNQQNTQIRQLTDDVSYYKAQIANQQKIIEQLNSRYDGVMSCLLTEKIKGIDIKGFFLIRTSKSMKILNLLKVYISHQITANLIVSLNRPTKRV
jgi:exonuclease VII large subunit